MAGRRKADTQRARKAHSNRGPLLGGVDAGHFVFSRNSGVAPPESFWANRRPPVMAAPTKRTRLVGAPHYEGAHPAEIPVYRAVAGHSGRNAATAPALPCGPCLAGGVRNARA